MLKGKNDNKIKKTELNDIVYILGSKREIIKRNFIAGVARGIGIGIGVTVVTATIVAILQKIIKLNIPVISDYIIDILDIVERNRKY